MKNYPLALLDLNKAIDLNSEFAPAYIIRAQTYLYTEKYQEALADCNTALKKDPTILRVHLIKEKVEQKLGKEIDNDES